MIQIEKFSDKLLSSEIDLFNKKQIHIICEADKEEASYCMKYLDICNFDHVKSRYFIDEVNQKNEVGCLYPAFNLSLFPQTDLLLDLNNKIDQIDSYLVDLIINANELYYKNDTMLIVFEKYNMPDKILMNQILKNFIQKNKSRIKVLNTILTNLV